MGPPAGRRRIARTLGHLTPAGELQRAQRTSAVAAAVDPFNDVATRPLTWSRALAAPISELYRDGPLSPQQWREWWEHGWTVIRAPPGVDYAGMKARLAALAEEN
eukprot:SAG11_NODE_16075_length_557_cov_1.349345_1_plen_104_part_10